MQTIKDDVAEELPSTMKHCLVSLGELAELPQDLSCYVVTSCLGVDEAVGVNPLPQIVIVVPWVIQYLVIVEDYCYYSRLPSNYYYFR